MNKYIILLLICLFYASFLNAQMTVWEYELLDATSFASMGCVDINNDDIQDVIMGVGGDIDDNRPKGVIALDGADGTLIWSVLSEEINQMYSIPEWIYINTDNIPDIVMGGRNGQLFAYDGTDGTELWAFDYETFFPEAIKEMNFYACQNVGDFNGDDIDDLLNMNGGTGLDNFRPAARLMLISGADGTVIQMDSVPDLIESYYSPHFLEEKYQANQPIFFGTGGETFPGKFWKVDLDDFMNNGLLNADIIMESDTKGFIAVASLVDMDGDNLLDYCIPSIDGRLTLISSASNETIWEIEKVGFENYVSPSVGYLNGDEIPDFSVKFHHGEFPAYDYFLRAFVDGQNGNIIMEDTFYNFSFYSDLLADIELNDGIDEVIVLDGMNPMELKYYNTVTDAWTVIESFPNAMNLASNPYIGDVDNNNQLDLLISYTEGDNLKIKRYEFNQSGTISWGNYFGNDGDAVFSDNLISNIFNIINNKESLLLNAYFDNGILNWNVEELTRNSLLQIYDMSGRLIHQNITNESSGEIHLPQLNKGQIYNIIYMNQKQIGVKKCIVR